MKKSTFIGNLVAWILVAAACCAFLAWYHMSDFDLVAAAIGDSPLVQVGVVLAAPLLLYAIGVVLGLMLVWFKKILMGRIGKRVCRVIGILALVFLLFAGLPALVPDAANTLLGPVVVVVYVSMMAPVLIVMLGFAYAVGCAGVDTSKRGPLSKYLPVDDGRRGRDDAE